ncbi:MAG: S41 family peptidase [Patescibacteria group bacterium]
MNEEHNGSIVSGKPNKNLIGYTLFAVLAIGLFISGIYIGQAGTILGQPLNFKTYLPGIEKVAPKEGVSLNEFWKVWTLLEEKFSSASSTASVAEETKIYGAIKGLVDSYGDPYTIFLPPSEAEQFEDDISGNFSGVGMEVGLRDGLITVISPLGGTPAESAGILSGDILVKIDDNSTEGMRIDEAVKLIRGEKGTVVKFSIYREGQSEFIEKSVTRDNIDIPTVKTEKIGDIFVISLYSFNAVSESKMQAAMNEFVSSKSEKLIIDVRGNPGGFLQSAVDIASFVLPSGKVVVKEQGGLTGEDKVFRTRNRQVKDFTSKNLVVLVDNGSASASEILAGALKDHGVATIIGLPTFGKGSVQELVRLEDGSSLKVTVARWFTPNGVSISDGGLSPDYVIKRTPEDREAGIDPQKDAALRFLRGETIESQSLSADFGEPVGG